MKFAQVGYGSNGQGTKKTVVALIINDNVKNTNPSVLF